VLRAIDLAILRGGPEHALSSRSLNIRASKILDAERKKEKERAAVSAADGTATTSHDRSKRRRVDPASTAPHGDSDSEAHCVHWTKGVQSGQLRAIPRVAAADLSPARFKTDYLATETPVIITGAIDDWPAMGGPARDGEREAGAEGARWDLDYLKLKAGDRLVPVELCDSSDRTQTYLTSSWERQVMNLRDYIGQYVIAPSTERGAGAHSGYLAQYALFNQIPTLREDIAVPRYCSEKLIGDADAEPPTGAGSAEDSTLLSTDEVQVSAWFGPAGTVSPLHHDPYHNVFAQVVGRKYVRLYPKDQTDRLYQRRDHLCNNSWVDIDNVDGDRFPLFDTATGLHCELGPGDLLHIPRGCWHYLTSLDVSFSVSFWWGARA
jgi:lysine-specific demethylase 8